MGGLSNRTLVHKNWRIDTTNDEWVSSGVPPKGVKKTSGVQAAPEKVGHPRLPESQPRSVEDDIMKTKQMLVLAVLLLGILLGQQAQAFYNPSTGRWLSRDPIADNPRKLKFQWITQTKNPHAFVENVSTTRVDPDGRQWYEPPIFPTDPFPPRYPNPSGYKCDCCTKQKVTESKNELIGRYNQAAGRLGELGVVPDSQMNKPNSLSCFESAEIIIEFMGPTPPCWVCFIEKRGPWLPGMEWHAAVVCFSTRSPQDIAVFDWFRGRPAGEGYGNYSTTFPTTLETYPKDRAERTFNDCSSPSSNWKPNLNRIDERVKKAQESAQ